MVTHLHIIGLRCFAVMYQGNLFGKSGLAGAENALKKLGLNAVARGGYYRSKPEEVDAAVAAIAAADPDAIIMVAANRASAAFIKRCAKKAVHRSCSAFQLITLKKC